MVLRCGNLNLNKSMKLLALTDLVEEFSDKINEVIFQCHADGHWVVPYTTIRDPWEQAKLWRRSRTYSQIVAAQQDLHTADAEFLSQCINDVGIQPLAPWATNALPGLSWHQWGEAVDCYIQDKNGHAIWDSTHPGYESYAQRAKEMGLDAGHYWTKKDSVHVQLRKGRVLDFHTLSEVDAEMLKRYYKS